MQAIIQKTEDPSTWQPVVLVQIKESDLETIVLGLNYQAIWEEEKISKSPEAWHKFLLSGVWKDSSRHPYARVAWPFPVKLLPTLLEYEGRTYVCSSQQKAAMILRAYDFVTALEGPSNEEPKNLEYYADNARRLFSFKHD